MATINQITVNSTTYDLAVSAANVSGTVANATTATKLGTSNKGSATQPIYLSAGAPTACTYTLAKSVPSDAKFTDTTYSAATSSTLGLVKTSTGITNSSGTISVAYGTAAGTACQGNDSRLSNSRTPTAHASTATTYGAGTASNYGHVKLSDNYTSSAGAASAGIAASSYAVNQCYASSDRAWGYVNQAKFTNTVNYPNVAKWIRVEVAIRPVSNSGYIYIDFEFYKGLHGITAYPVKGFYYDSNHWGSVGLVVTSTTIRLANENEWTKVTYSGKTLKPSEFDDCTIYVYAK